MSDKAFHTGGVHDFTRVAHQVPVFKSKASDVEINLPSVDQKLLLQQKKGSITSVCPNALNLASVRFIDILANEPWSVRTQREVHKTIWKINLPGYNFQNKNHSKIPKINASNLTFFFTPNYSRLPKKHAPIVNFQHR